MTVQELIDKLKERPGHEVVVVESNWFVGREGDRYGHPEDVVPLEVGDDGPGQWATMIVLE